MLLIKNGKIFTMEGIVLEESSILIKNGKIEEIGKEIKITKDVEVIDAKGKIVMPGFIDAHTHIAILEDGIGFEGSDINEMIDPITPELRAIDAINPMDTALKDAYKSGVTCAAVGPGSANIIGGQFATIKTYGKRIDNMIIKAPTAMKCAFGENPKRVYNGKGKSPMTRMATAALFREILMKTKEYDRKIKSAGEDESKRPKFDIKLESMLSVIHGEIPLKAHAHRADDIFTAIRIAKEFGLKLTLDHCTEGHLIADELAKEGYDTIIGPSLTSKSKYELREKSFKTPGVLSKAGLKVAITTDCPVIPLEYLPICASLAVKSGMDREEALKAITINPAQILGIDHRVGSIKKGKDADIVIFDGDPLEIQSKVLYTIVDGNIIYKLDI